MGEDKQQPGGVVEPPPTSVQLPYSAMAVLGCAGAVIGFVYGFVLSYFALGLMAGGHGWGGAVVALPSVILVSLLGFAWGFSQSRLADLFMAPVLSFAIFVDAIFFITFDHTTYVRAPGSFQWFFLLWGGWQIPLLALLILRLKATVAPMLASRLFMRPNLQDNPTQNEKEAS